MVNSTLKKCKYLGVGSQGTEVSRNTNKNYRIHQVLEQKAIFSGTNFLTPDTPCLTPK